MAKVSGSVLALLGAATLGAQPPPKQIVRQQSDLPRFSYPIPGLASALAKDGGADFNALADKFSADVNRVLNDYQIEDRATLRQYVGAKVDLAELHGDAAGGLRAVDELRALQDKPAARLLTGLSLRSIFQSMLESGESRGPAFDAAFTRNYEAAVDPLPWDLVGDSITAGYVSARTYTGPVSLAYLMTDVDPAATTSKAVDFEEAENVISARADMQSLIPTGPLRAKILEAYIAAHRKPQPDIWRDREVTISAGEPSTPVVIAIWDSGVDVNDFPGQVFDDPHPTPSGRHGVAFTDDGGISHDWTFPLSASEKAAYPGFQTLLRGRQDMERGIDSPAARSLVWMNTHSTPEQLHNVYLAQQTLGFYVHGTHCAGIAVRGNAAARLAVARFDDELPNLSFPPSDAWANRLAEAFHQMGRFFRTRHVRVVNMSWGDWPSEFEEWLIKTGKGGEPGQRKLLAANFYRRWREAVRKTIADCPGTLFVCSAGNQDANSGFEESIPAALNLPNLITVGAVNQAGQETSFTSYGETVPVYANGYEVESSVPGGSRLRLSGTSMASPNVVNLAGKLFALNPALTPVQVISLIKRGATPSADGRLRLIDEKRSVELMKKGELKSSP
ncbi:MAG TPA: S8 family serine peptidase [Opitutaceae bacterium]|jgi:subtilisin family serine protease